ncbi:MAG TPA: hypothetical protein VGB62_08895 [Allosphingosinicella sp.]
MLAAADIISVWELGSSRPDWSKALIALGAAMPEVAPGALAQMTIGERNAHLLSLRRDVIGPLMHAMVRCPVCREPLEFEQSIDELLDGYAPPSEREFAFVSDEYSVRYRLLDSQDLAQAADFGSEAHTREVLAERALIAVSRGDVAIPASDLPQDIGEALSREMADRDPLAHIAIPLACIECEHVWPATLQILPYLWQELERKAKHVLEDVVAIARAYGWSEAEILGMGSERRQYYLDSIE